MCILFPLLFTLLTVHFPSTSFSFSDLPLSPVTIIPGEQCTRDLDPTSGTQISVFSTPRTEFFQKKGNRAGKTYEIKSAALGLLSDIRADLREVGDVGWQGGSWVGQIESAAIAHGTEELD